MTLSFGNCTMMNLGLPCRGRLQYRPCAEARARPCATAPRPLSPNGHLRSYQTAKRCGIQCAPRRCRGRLSADFASKALKLRTANGHLQSISDHHIGSLPRNEDLMQTMFAREDGIALDEAALEAKIVRAVQDVAVRQVAAGIDIVNDGEMPKPSYATTSRTASTVLAARATASRFRTSRRIRTSRRGCFPTPDANIARRRPATAPSASGMWNPPGATRSVSRRPSRENRPPTCS